MNLLQCPFCGSNVIKQHEDLGDTFSYCYDCSGQAPENQWNTRNTPWISVKDKLPTLHSEVLICSDNEMFVGYLEIDNEFYSYGEIILSVTHWMPIPQLPE